MARVNQELTFSRKPESNLPLNGNYNTNKPTSKQCVKDEQPVRKRKALTTLRNVSYEPIYYSQYLPENPNLFKPILNDLGVKTNHTYVLKLLFAAAEIIHRLDEERFFLSNLIVNTLKIIPRNQKLHSNNSMIIYIDELTQFGLEL